MEHQSNGKGVEGVVRRNPANGSVSINGRVTGLGPQPQTIYWMAAAPVTRGIGFAGSGAPYPNREIAFENTPHHGNVNSTDGSFSIQLKDIPAGYYAGLGSIYIPPMVEFISVLKDGTKFASTLWVTDVAVPYRWIAGAPATLRPSIPDNESMGRAMYYEGRDKLPIFENQEALLRARGYPGDMAGRGWSAAEDAKPWTHTPAPA
jgi:hypothetical protein